MTREEREKAIRILDDMKVKIDIPKAAVMQNDKNWALDMAIKSLKQEPRKGHWFVDERPESDREIICSNCEQPIFKYHKMDFDYRPKFCPACGAKMVDPQEARIQMHDIL